MPSESETGKIQKKPGSGKAPRPSTRKKDAASKRQTPQTKVRQLIRFAVDDVEFGIDIEYVREVRRASEMTIKDTGQSGAVGVITESERVVSVVDLRRSLGYGPRTMDPASRIIIFEHNDEIRGALVDRVIDVLRLEHAVNEKLTEPIIPIDPGMIYEVLIVEERRVVVLDWMRILGL